MNDAIDLLPETIRKKFTTSEGKREFLKQFVAEELFYDKAKRLRLDSEPEIRKQLNYVERQMLVQKVLETDVYKKISMDEQDLQNYFKANQSKYGQKPRAAVSLIKVKTKEAASQVSQKLKSGESFEKLVDQYSIDEESKKNQGKLPGYVYEGEKFDNFSKDVSDTILRTKAGKWTPSVLSAGTYCIFLVRTKEPKKEPDFNEDRKTVEMDYKMQKGQQLYQQLVDEAIKGDKVELFPEKIK